MQEGICDELKLLTLPESQHSVERNPCESLEGTVLDPQGFQNSIEPG